GCTKFMGSCKTDADCCEHLECYKYKWCGWDGTF
uniref:Mu/delta-theraphotoxin-Pm2a n=1 Tax=Poecilotheria metallica TaxID=1956341 RepID=PME2A_POEME|nr:RecName: Full=Mu/delta-theraphotoxin-Pm2a; Short=Mu/delta-TRTX-Pm2a; AltName: Full=Delta/mu-theraphotoxin-Pm2a [Poecilotheria metallica]